MACPAIPTPRRPRRDARRSRRWSILLPSAITRSDRHWSTVAAASSRPAGRTPQSVAWQTVQGFALKSWRGRQGLTTLDSNPAAVIGILSPDACCRPAGSDVAQVNVCCRVLNGVRDVRTDPVRLLPWSGLIHIFRWPRFWVWWVTDGGRMAAKDVLGRRGEDVAAAWLERTGLLVLDRNWRCSEGELDIVATDPVGAERVVVFCEVKTRIGDGYGSPFDAVTQGKRRKLRRLGLLWLAQPHVRGFPRMRFDVVGVLWRPGGEPTVDHRVEAF